MVSSLATVLLAQHPVEAEAPWRAWREGVVLDALEWSEIQLLPLLPQAQLEGWLGDDPAAGRLLGLVRRAWSEAQLQLHQLRGVVGELQSAGVGPLMIAGEAALHSRLAETGRIRPIGELQLLLPREQIYAADQRLRQLHWRPATPSPPPKALNWVDQWLWSRPGQSLRLLWRPTRVVPWRAREYEEELWSRPEPVLPAAHLLVARLAEGARSQGSIPWQMDAALLPLSEAEWAAAAGFAARYAPAAFARIQARRGGGAEPGSVRRSRIEHTMHRGMVLLRARLLNSLR
jgi:hypothetical protein